MVLHDRDPDPTKDPAAPAVLAAFDAAQDAGMPSMDCYRPALRHGAMPIPTTPPDTPAARRWRLSTRLGSGCASTMREHRGFITREAHPSRMTGGPRVPASPNFEKRNGAASRIFSIPWSRWRLTLGRIALRLTLLRITLRCVAGRRRTAPREAAQLLAI